MTGGNSSNTFQADADTVRRLDKAMANEDLQSMDEEAAFKAQLGSRGSQFTKVALGLVTILSVVMVVGWYWPLHRAHAALRIEYVKASDNSKALRSKLDQTLAALKKNTMERDTLRQSKSAVDESEAARRKAIDSLVDEVNGNLKPYIDKKWVSVAKSELTVTVTLQSRVLQQEKAIELTRAGAAVLCEAIKTLKSPKAVHVRLEGLATDAQAEDRALKPYESALEVGAARAARAASKAVSCGASAKELAIGASSPPKGSEHHTLRVVFEANPAPAVASETPKTEAAKGGG